MPPLEVWSDAMNDADDPRAPEAGSTPPPLTPGPPTGPALAPPSGPEPTPESPATKPEPFWVRRRRQQAEKQEMREGGDAPGGELKQTRAEKRRAKQEERRAKREARRAERQGDPPNEQAEPLRPLSEEPWDTSEALTETAMPVVIPDVPAPPAPAAFGDDPAFGERGADGRRA